MTYIKKGFAKLRGAIGGEDLFGGGILSPENFFVSTTLANP